MYVGKFSMCSGTSVWKRRASNNYGEAPCPHPLTHAVKRVRHSLCPPSNLEYSSNSLSHRRRLGRQYSSSRHTNNIKMPVKQAREWVTPSSSPKEKEREVSKPCFWTMSSTGTSSTSTAGGPKAPTTAKSNPFSALEEKGPTPSNDPLKTNGGGHHPFHGTKKARRPPSRPLRKKRMLRLAMQKFQRALPKLCWMPCKKSGLGTTFHLR